MRGLLALVCLGFSLSATAQTLEFTATTVTGAGSVIPELTWNTTPAADECEASGAWSGPKSGSGTETLPAITSSATYNLACTWFGGSVTLTWTLPTQNTDGSALTDLSGIKIYYGNAAGGPYPNEIDLPGAPTTHTIPTVPPGEWYFVSTAYNANDVESDRSNEATKTVTGDVVTETVGITVNPKPQPPSDLSMI